MTEKEIADYIENFQENKYVIRNLCLKDLTRTEYIKLPYLIICSKGIFGITIDEKDVNWVALAVELTELNGKELRCFVFHNVPDYINPMPLVYNFNTKESLSNGIEFAFKGKPELTSKQMKYYYKFYSDFVEEKNQYLRGYDKFNLPFNKIKEILNNSRKTWQNIKKVLLYKYGDKINKELIIWKKSF